MRMLLYRVDEEAAEVDVADDAEAIGGILGTGEQGRMTVRMLRICILHDPEGGRAGRPLNRMLGRTPLYGDFLVCGIDWDDKGSMWAVALDEEQVQVVRDVIFDRLPTDADAGGGPL